MFRFLELYMQLSVIQTNVFKSGEGGIFTHVGGYIQVI